MAGPIIDTYQQARNLLLATLRDARNSGDFDAYNSLLADYEIEAGLEPTDPATWSQQWGDERYAYICIDSVRSRGNADGQLSTYRDTAQEMVTAALAAGAIASADKWIRVVTYIDASPRLLA